MPSHAPRTTLDTFQRLFYSIRESTGLADGAEVRFVATMNGGTLQALGREVAMGGVVALLGLPAACEEAGTRADGPTGITLWDVEIVLDSRLGDSEIRMEAAPPAGKPPGT